MALAWKMMKRMRFNMIRIIENVLNAVIMSLIFLMIITLAVLAMIMLINMDIYRFTCISVGIVTIFAIQPMLHKAKDIRRKKE